MVLTSVVILVISGRSVGVATDMGHMQKSVVRALAGVDVLLLESNYDPALLRQNEPPPLRL